MNAGKKLVLPKDDHNSGKLWISQFIVTRRWIRCTLPRRRIPSGNRRATRSAASCRGEWHLATRRSIGSSLEEQACYLIRLSQRGHTPWNNNNVHNTQHCSNTAFALTPSIEMACHERTDILLVPFETSGSSDQPEQLFTEPEQTEPAPGNLPEQPNWIRTGPVRTMAELTVVRTILDQQLI